MLAALYIVETGCGEYPVDFSSWYGYVLPQYPNPNRGIPTVLAALYLVEMGCGEYPVDFSSWYG